MHASSPLHSSPQQDESEEQFLERSKQGRAIDQYYQPVFVKSTDETWSEKLWKKSGYLQGHRYTRRQQEESE
jgi:hypothetical protein